MHLGIVIRKDGTVPFDADVHPAHKQAMLGALMEMGHKVERQPDGGYKIANFDPTATK